MNRNLAVTAGLAALVLAGCSTSPTETSAAPEDGLTAANVSTSTELGAGDVKCGDNCASWA